MPALPTDWSALCALVFLLGLRHGLDADHLAAIDGLTRLSARRQQPHARLCGALFSLGHGAVVVAIALLAGALGARWMPPTWFETLGGCVSIAFLALIGLVNLRAAWRAPADTPVPLVMVRGRLLRALLGRRQAPSRPGAVMGVGALFALSFDTLSQSALFAMLGLQFGGVAHALLLGLLFMLGMVLSDGLNGWWVARLIDRSDRRAARASRVMTLAVAGVSLLVAGLGMARMASRWAEGLLEAHALGIGLAVAGLITSSYLLASRLGDREAAATPESKTARPA